MEGSYHSLWSTIYMQSSSPPNKYKIFLQEEKSSLFIFPSLNLCSEKENGKYWQRKLINCLKDIWKILGYLGIFLKRGYSTMTAENEREQFCHVRLSLASPLTGLLAWWIGGFQCTIKIALDSLREKMEKCWEERENTKQLNDPP